jgi:hypothetical protein
MSMWICLKCGRGNDQKNNACWHCETMRDTK